jgi:hypothetical protein
MKIINHLVLSGGGPNMFKLLGACQNLESQGVWNINNLQTIYGTSAGGIIGTLLCLKYDWETLDNYMIQRPWHDAYAVNIQTIFDAYTRRGLFDQKAIEIFMKPLMLGKDLSLNITLKEYYEYSGIELHLFTFEINNFVVEDISYKTHPELPLLIALQMTSALPIIISPVLQENKCYIDGGVAANYPLNFLLQRLSDEKNGNTTSENVLAFKNIYDVPDISNVEKKFQVRYDSTLLDYIINFLYKLIFNLNTEKKQDMIENEVHIHKTQLMTLSYLKKVLCSQNIRRELFEEGKLCATTFLQKEKEKENNN